MRIRDHQILLHYVVRSLTILGKPQVFLAIAVFLGDGLYHFTKIACISLWAIKNGVTKKDNKDEANDEALPVSESSAISDKVWSIPEWQQILALPDPQGFAHLLQFYMSQFSSCAL